MSTRSGIFKETSLGPRGAYVHSDGYPNGGVGQFLWDSYHDFFKGDLDKMLEFFIEDHPGGWSMIVGTDLSITPKYADAPMNGRDENGDPTEEMERWLATPRCYCHPEGDRESEDDNIFYLNFADPGDLEWAYVFDVKMSTMSVHALKNGSHGWPVAKVDLNGVEPDWVVMECGENFERCTHYAWYHFPELKGGPLSRIGTQSYLGNKPMTINDAIGFINRKGERATWNGSSRTEGGVDVIPRILVATVTLSDDRRVEWAVAITEGDHYVPLDGVTWIFPPIKGSEEETFVSAPDTIPYWV